MADKITNKMSESDNRIATWEDEDRYWRERYRERPYASADLGYSYYRVAYRYGWDSANRYQGRNWSEVEPELERGWEQARGGSKSTWDEIKAAVRDAWDRVTGGESKVARRKMAEEMNPDVQKDRETR
jgi:hypothetical protein